MLVQIEHKKHVFKI